MKLKKWDGSAAFRTTRMYDHFGAVRVESRADYAEQLQAKIERRIGEKRASLAKAHFMKYVSGSHLPSFFSPFLPRVLLSSQFPSLLLHPMHPTPLYYSSEKTSGKLRRRESSRDLRLMAALGKTMRGRWWGMGRGTRRTTSKVTGRVHNFMPLGVTRSSLTDIRIKIPT